MRRISIAACSAVLVLSVNVQAGGLFDAFKESLEDVAKEVKKDVQYSVDQTLRNAFPALKTASEPEASPDGFSNENEVVVYGFESCPYCVKVENLLRDNRIPYKDMDVQKSKTAKRKFQKLGGGGVPVTVIGDQVIRGWSEAKIMALLKEQGFI